MVLQNYKAVFRFSWDLHCNYGEGNIWNKKECLVWIRLKIKFYQPPGWLFFCDAGDRKQFFKVGQSQILLITSALLVVKTKAKNIY